MLGLPLLQEPEVPCFGCLRVFGTDFDFSSPGNIPFPWLYNDGRGCWCRDCSNVYRTMYKSKMTMTLFTKWVANNRLTLIGQLLAYLTLKRDGELRVSARMMEDREKLLRYAFSLVEVPYPSFQTTFAENAIGNSNAFFKRAMGEGMPPVLALVPAQARTEATEKARLVSPCQGANLPWPLQPLICESPEMAAAWKKAFPDVDMAAAAASTCTDLVAVGRVRDVAPQLSVAEQGAKDKLDGIATSTSVLIMGFFGNDVDKLSEKEFTSMITKAVKLKNGFCNSDVAPAYIGELDGVLSVLNSGKKFVRPFREYTKIGKQHWLPQMYPPMNAVFEYVKSQTSGPNKLSGRMQSAWMKSSFFYSVDDGGLRSGLSCMIAIKREGAVEVERFGTIASEILSIHTYQLLSKECDDEEFRSSDWAVAKQWCLERATELRDFSTAAELQDIESFKEMSGCLGDFFNLASAACDPSSVTSKAIMSSRKNIDSKMVATKIAEGLKKGSVGLALTADVDKVMARGELDEQCTGLMNS